MFYVNHPYMNIVVQNVTMSGQTANTSAAIAYITRGNQFNITDSTVTDFVASETTFLYSSSPNLRINILRTTVTCNTSYNYESVLAQLLAGNYNY